MSWTNQGKYWSRPLDSVDRGLQVVSAVGAPLGREPMMTFVWVKLALPLRVDALTFELRLANAWGLLRLRYPDLALTLHDNEKRYVPLADDMALADFVDDTLHVEKGKGAASSDDQLFSRTRRSLSKHDYATCHWIPASGELGLMSPHWRWDGVGSVQVLRALLDVLATTLGNSNTATTTASSSLITSPGTEAARLVPTLDAVLGLSDEELHRPKYVQRAAELLAPLTGPNAQSLYPTAGLRVRHDPDADFMPAELLPGDSCRAATRIKKPVMAAVLAACRARGLRFTAALNASIAQVCKEYHDEGKEKDKDRGTVVDDDDDGPREMMGGEGGEEYWEVGGAAENGRRSQDKKTYYYKGWAVHNMRPWARSPVSSHAVGLRVASWPVAIPVSSSTDDNTWSSSSWHMLSTEFQKVYDRFDADPDSSEAQEMIRVAAPLVEGRTAWILAQLQGGAQSPPHTTPTTTTTTTVPSLSSLGSLDGLFQGLRGEEQGLRVVDFSGAVQIVDSYLVVHAWGLKGETTISISYNEAFYEREFLVGWLDRVKGNLLQNLGVVGRRHVSDFGLSARL